MSDLLRDAIQLIQRAGADHRLTLQVIALVAVIALAVVAVLLSLET